MLFKCLHMLEYQIRLLFILTPPDGQQIINNPLIARLHIAYALKRMIGPVRRESRLIDERAIIKIGKSKGRDHGGYERMFVISDRLENIVLLVIEQITITIP